MSDEKIVSTHEAIHFKKGEGRKIVKNNPIQDKTAKAVSSRNTIPYGKVEQRPLPEIKIMEENNARSK